MGVAGAFEEVEMQEHTSGAFGKQPLPKKEQKQQFALANKSQDGVRCHLWVASIDAIHAIADPCPYQKGSQ